MGTVIVLFFLGYFILSSTVRGFRNNVEFCYLWLLRPTVSKPLLLLAPKEFIGIWIPGARSRVSTLEYSYADVPDVFLVFLNMFRVPKLPLGNKSGPSKNPLQECV